MGTSIFLAKAFSIYFIVVGLALLTRRKAFQEAITDFTPTEIIKNMGSSAKSVGGWRIRQAA